MSDPVRFHDLHLIKTYQSRGSKARNEREKKRGVSSELLFRERGEDFSPRNDAKKSGQEIATLARGMIVRDTLRLTRTN